MLGLELGAIIAGRQHRALRTLRGGQVESTSDQRKSPTDAGRRFIGFPATDRKQWSANGKSYIHGLFKMLHTDGSHPGLSDEDHCTSVCTSSGGNPALPATPAASRPG